MPDALTDERLAEIDQVLEAHKLEMFSEHGRLLMPPTHQPLIHAARDLRAEVERLRKRPNYLNDGRVLIYDRDNPQPNGERHGEEKE